MSDIPLLQVDNLKKHFPAGGDWFSQMFDKRTIKAVDGVSFSIRRGETLGLVGESGSGKTTVGRMIARLLDPSEGSVRYDDQDIAFIRPERMKAMRRRIQMVFQDPSSSLNRRKTVGQIVSEPLQVHKLVSSTDQESRIIEVLAMAGLSKRFLNRYPHEMSGGQRQRVGIARALAVEPEFIICDEPVTALDVSIQAQILNLLVRLQDELSLTYLFIAHDLSVVRHMSNQVAVMYLGHIMELADSKTLFREPKHPYTRALLHAVPEPDPRARKRNVLQGDIPNPISPPSGCPFHPRCPEYLGDVCKLVHPPVTTLPDGTQVKCHRYSESNGNGGGNG